MKLEQKTLEKLRLLINEETEYRSGPKLVSFFNSLGFKDSYGQGFPSRWIFTDEKLMKINGTPEIDLCIKKLFNPVNFINRINELDNFIKDFNQYLQFDGWSVIRENKEINFKKVNEINFTNTNVPDENEFLQRKFSEVSIDSLEMDDFITGTLKQRIEEMNKCLDAKASLSVIFLAGSTLEGILLGFASKFPQEYNQASRAPKESSGKVKQFQSWTLSHFIEVASEVGHLKEDVRKFSHALRDFRNYIHPFQQASSRFNPDEHSIDLLAGLKYSNLSVKSNIKEIVHC